MNYSDYRFTLDVQLQQAQVSVPATFGDSARRLCIGLTDGRKPYTIGEGCFAVFNAKKPDNTIIKNYCIIENNTVIYEFTPNTTNCEGIVNCDITIYGADGKVLTSPRFVIVVDEAVVRDDETPESEFTAFAEAVKEESLRKANENTRIANENTRMNNEDDRNIGEYGRTDCRWNADQQCYVDSVGVEIPIDEIGGRVGAEIAREAVIGDIGEALDVILAIQESLLPKVLTFSLTDPVGTSTYSFEEGMTWEQWVNSEHNTIGAYVSFGVMVPYLTSYYAIIDPDTGFLVSEGDDIVPEKTYYHQTW